MAYSDPPQAANLQLMGPADWNQLVDDITDLHRRTTAGGLTVNVQETTTSTSYTNLATSGPTATVTIGANGIALITLTANVSNDTASNWSNMGFAVSGATTVAATDVQCLSVPALAGIQLSATYLVGGLNAGATTFTAKYRVTGGTGYFQYRSLIAVPLNA